METNYFIPDREAPRILWLNNFSMKAPAYATKYGLTAAETTDLVNGALYYQGIMNGMEQWNSHKQAYTRFKNGMANGIEPGASLAVPPTPVVTLPTGTAVPQPGIFKRAAYIAGRIKGHQHYDVADGAEMGLEGSEMAGRGTDVPVLSLSVIAGQVHVNWSKARGVDAVEIDVDRGSGWQFLAVDTIPDYVDTFSLPGGTAAVWKYRAVYRIGDSRDGDYSAVVSIAVGN